MRNPVPLPIITEGSRERLPGAVVQPDECDASRDAREGLGRNAESGCGRSLRTVRTASANDEDASANRRATERDCDPNEQWPAHREAIPAPG